MFNNTYKRSSIVIIILVLISLCGVAQILFLTSLRGSGLSPDSVSYIAAARNILNGNGVTVLFNADGSAPLNLWYPVNNTEVNYFTKWPPLYPFILSITGIFGLNVIEGARWLSAILFGLNIFLMGFIIKQITKSTLLPILTSILFLFSKDIIFIHYMAWSEPLFILLAFLGIFLLINYLTEKKQLFLYLSSFLIGLAFLTRYAGATLIITGVIGIIFLNGEKIIEKLKQALIFIAISCLPVGVWILRLKFLGSAANTRQLIFIPIKIDEIKMALDNITKWIATGRFSFNSRVTLLAIFSILVVIGFILINRKIRDKKIYKEQKYINKAAKLFLIFICVYLGFIILIRYTVSANLDFWDNRHLTPIFVSSLSIVVLLLKSVLNLVENKKKIKTATKALVYSVFIIFIGFYIAYFYYGNHIYTNKALYIGIGYSRNDWKTSEAIKELKKFPDSTLIYTNEPTAVYILADRASYMIPSKIDLSSHKSNKKYDEEIKIMTKELKENDGIIVMFDTGLGFLPNKEQLEKDIRIKPINSYTDGVIYEM